MQEGFLTVASDGEVKILLLGRPNRIVVYFKPDDPVPCNPHHHHHHHHDSLEYEIIHEDESLHEHHKLVHHHHNRQFFLQIKWKVTTIREVVWKVIY